MVDQSSGLDKRQVPFLPHASRARSSEQQNIKESVINFNETMQEIFKTDRQHALSVFQSIHNRIFMINVTLQKLIRLFSGQGFADHTVHEIIIAIIFD